MMILDNVQLIVLIFDFLSNLIHAILQDSCLVLLIIYNYFVYNLIKMDLVLHDKLVILLPQKADGLVLIRLCLILDRHIRVNLFHIGISDTI
jgi:hypothetical protein